MNPIRKLRQARGETQAELAHRWGISTRTVVSLEAGASASMIVRRLGCMAEGITFSEHEALFGPRGDKGMRDVTLGPMALGEQGAGVRDA